MPFIETKTGALLGRALSKWKKLNGEIDFDDAIALNFWTKHGNTILQDELRRGSLTPSVKQFKEQLERALAKWNTSGGPVDITYRGLPTADYVSKRWKKGSVVDLDAFEATTTSRKVADLFGVETAGWHSNTAVIEFRGIKYGRSLNAISEFAGESEILLPPGTRIRVLDVIKSDADSLFGTETKIVVELIYE